jgi:hypothetical protein
MEFYKDKNFSKMRWESSWQRYYNGIYYILSDKEVWEKWWNTVKIVS